MDAVVFDLKGKVAHFRRPDTTATQLTYPFITPTAAKGLVGSILGKTDFVTNDQIGIQLLQPVRTSAQQLSLIGKDAGKSFNRPTTMELLVAPAYRLYYVGDEHVTELAEKLNSRQSVYHTYLGVAFALTFPELVTYETDVQTLNTADASNTENASSAANVAEDDVIETPAVVPTQLVRELILEEERYYSRAGGFMQDYLGERTFERSLAYIYEKDGRPISFRLNHKAEASCRVAYIGGKAICLV
ncbi:CRISPR-associated protein Cas5 [Numidum massiliense]|uniref:CRISPR-associated protein Cas5 n=1 Tax=Numidum massiliense TaxID=1522315 RepID=UPI0006D57B2B|nr:CRISPR-associated protein Cas5 [Numidum massiliense]